MQRGSHRLDWARDGADWPHREASSFVAEAGMRWHVQRMGEGPVALLIHGAGGASHSWRDVMPLLARDFTVIAPDLPGHGFTSAPHGAGLSLPNMAVALARLLHALGVSPSLAVGHSAGAAVLARMTLDGGVAPRALIAFNGAFLPFKGMAGRLFPPMARLLALNPLTSRVVAWTVDSAAVSRLLRNTGSQIDARGMALYRRLFSSPGHVDATLGMMAHWDLEPLANALPRLRTPLELVVGDADRAVPPGDAAEVRRLVSHARIAPLAGLGHLAHEEQPETAAGIIRRVFAENAG